MGKDTKEKESKCKYAIDYEKSIIDNKFKRLQKTGNESFTPILIKCWIIYINPRDSANLNKIIKDKFSLDTTDFRHLKKFNKDVIRDDENKGKNDIRLKCLLCSLDYINDKSTIERILSDGGVVYDKIDIADIPKNKPFDKDVNKEWSEKYWPIVWKGNPLIQEMNQLGNEFNMDVDLNYLRKLVELSKDITNDRVSFINVFCYIKKNEHYTNFYIKKNIYLSIQICLYFNYSYL